MVVSVFSGDRNEGVLVMARDLLLWLFGVPISVIVLLHLFGVLHW
ncbi:hypothetical protein [Hyphomicrobium sp. NDB2Meth4]|nr:hypothetical protein [Hyphomicrobium sp. NDB2Meth4]